MQLFLPYADDLPSTARFLDDQRLNKQIIEAYQIGLTVLKMLDGYDKGWARHPATKFVYNNGKPKFSWLALYIKTLDSEWNRRGFIRSEKMRLKLQQLFENITRFEFDNKHVCSFVGKIEGITKTVYDSSMSEVSKLYQQLLFDKWNHDKIPAKCTIDAKRSLKYVHV